MRSEKDRALRLCVEWRRLKSLLVPYNGGLGDMQRIFASLRDKQNLTRLDLTTGFNQVPIAEKEECKTALRDPDGRLWKFNRKVLGLMVLPATFMRIVKRSPGTTDPNVASLVDDILTTMHTWEEHLARLKSVFTKLLVANLSVNSANRGPTESECVDVLYVFDHYREYLTGRRFTLVTDCYAITCLFRSRDLSAKLQR